MKKKQLFLAATAILLASCTDTTYLGDKAAIGEGAGGVITFESSTPNLTRTGGPEAAAMLNNNFVVYGFKTMGSTTTTDQVVFDNYQVNFVENSAQTTASNIKDWEYVGDKNLPNGVSTPVGVVAFSNDATVNAGAIDQTIKYWDFSATSYDFFAYSLGKGVTTTSGTTYATSSAMASTNGGTFTLTGSTAELQACYISEKVNRTKGGSAELALDKGNTSVQFNFLSFATKVRLGIYETIPGYSVKDVVFYENATTTTGSATATLYDAGSTASIPDGGQYTVTFDASTGKPVLTFATTTGYTNAAYQSYGELTNFAGKDYKEADGSYLGRAANAATFAGSDYTKVLPNPAGTELTLKVDYTLVSRDGSGETIEVKGATAKVPANFAQWKPNYAYTYLFKITDDPNGTIGDVAGLYPITFDAVVIDNTEGSQQTITTVTTPSITTYQNGVVTDDYTVANGDIYVTVEGDAGALLPLQTTDGTTTTVKGALYTFTDNHTEAEIVKTLKVQSAVPATAVTGSIQGRNGILLTPATMTITDKVGEKDFGTDMVGQFTPTASTNYAFVYTKKAPTGDPTPAYEIKTFTAGDAVTGYWCQFKFVDAPAGDAQVGTTYYDKTTYVKTDLFCGQSAAGLYIMGTSNELIPASGNVQTGTDYYPAPTAVTTGDYDYYYGQSASGLYVVDPNNTGQYIAADGYVTEGTDYFSDDQGTAVTTGKYKNGMDVTGLGLYTKSGSNYIPVTSGTIDGSLTYYTAPNAVATVAYTSFGTTLFKKTTTGIVSVETTDTPSSDTEYYTENTGTTRVYILPQQTNGYSVLSDLVVATDGEYRQCVDGEKAIAGKTYYDKFDQNNGEYAVKVIKVQ